jgi:hypothetical protein
MLIGSGDYQYKWIEDWIKIPDSVSARENGRTHGVCVTSNGNVIIFNQADPGVLLYNSCRQTD